MASKVESSICQHLSARRGEHVAKARCPLQTRSLPLSGLACHPKVLHILHGRLPSIGSQVGGSKEGCCGLQSLTGRHMRPWDKMRFHQMEGHPKDQLCSITKCKACSGSNTAFNQKKKTPDTATKPLLLGGLGNSPQAQPADYFRSYLNTEGPTAWD